MKILFLTSTFPRFASDSQSPFVLEQARAWLSKRPNDQVIVLAPGSHKVSSYEKIDGIEVHRFNYFFPSAMQLLAYPALQPALKKNPLLFFQLPFFLVVEFFAIIRLVLQYRVDLVYAHWILPQGLLIYFAHLLLRVNYVVHTHSSDLQILTSIPLIGTFFARKIIKNAQMFFCVNSALRDNALALFSESERVMMQKKIVVMSMGVNINFKSQISNHKYRYDFGFIGRLSKKKGVSYLLDAVSHVNEKMKVGIAGDGEEVENLKFQISNLKLEDKVDLVGHITGQKKLEFIENCRIMVFPSLSSGGDVEGLPVALLEALALGKNVVVAKDTNINLMPEWTDIKSEVFLLDDPQNIKEFVVILQKALRLSSDENQRRSSILKKVFKKYAWHELINNYISYLTK